MQPMRCCSRQKWACSLRCPAKNEMPQALTVVLSRKKAAEGDSMDEHGAAQAAAIHKACRISAGPVREVLPWSLAKDYKGLGWVKGRPGDHHGGGVSCSKSTKARIVHGGENGSFFTESGKGKKPGG